MAGHSASIRTATSPASAGTAAGSASRQTTGGAGRPAANVVGGAETAAPGVSGSSARGAAAFSTRGGSPPPPDSDPGIDLRVPQEAVGKGFAAYVFFTLFNGGRVRPPDSGLTFSFLFPGLASVGTAVLTGQHANLQTPVKITGTYPKGGALGAVKTLTPTPDAPAGSAAWWLWVLLVGALLLLVALALIGLRRRRPPPAAAS